MADDPNQLYDLASDLLQAIVDYYAEYAVPLPGRRYVSGAQPAFDCEQVTVEMVRVFPGLPGVGETAQGNILGCAFVRTVEWQVSIIRCAPTPKEKGEFPSEDELEGFGHSVLRDAWMLMFASIRGKSQGLYGSECQNFRIQQLGPINPQGGFGGAAVLIQMEVG